MDYRPSPQRYDSMLYNRCGRSGIRLPAVSLGLWHNFGGVDRFENARAMVRRAFDLGVTHFDLANNYGPPYGSAEETFGRILVEDLGRHRDELIVSSKAGWDMWPGPYGDWGSRKYLVASLDQSLGRLGLEYVDIFYHHRPDHRTPLEETMGALDAVVRQGKALYAGISAYSPEEGLLAVLEEEGLGCIAFSPLEQGLLTDRYLEGIPEDSRAAKEHGFLEPAEITEHRLAKVRRLSEVAAARGQSLAQMALAWALRHGAMTSVLFGASRVAHVEAAVGALAGLEFSAEELGRIDAILGAT